MKNTPASDDQSVQEKKPLLQSAWQQARTLKPCINLSISVSRRRFRDEQWYVLKHSGSERLHRINAAAWQIIGQCDGNKTLEQIYQNYCLAVNDTEKLNEIELLEIINKFIFEGLITTDNPAPVNMPKRADSAGGWLKRFSNPVAIRIPLWDPDHFLLRHVERVRYVFSYAAWYVWILFIFLGLMLAGLHWAEISHNVVDRILRPNNLLWLWLIYPLTKLVHELGHAFVVKIHGGAVHETGIMFMFGVPLPYVDASAASSFIQKRHRLLVDAIGIMIELFIAVLALIIWLNVESGLISQFAYNTMIICSVSTLFFNGNPLMRFDGYYLLADFLEMPNLATRSTLYWRYLFKRYLFNIPDVVFAADNRERYWLLFYGFSALVYRIVLLSGIVFIAAQYYLLLGLLLAALFVYQMVLKPAVKLFGFLTSERIAEHKRRAWISLFTLFVCLALLVSVVPFSVHRTLPAVVWMPEQAQVRAGTEGFVELVLVEEGEEVVINQPLFRLRDPYLGLERQIAKAKGAELEVKYSAARVQDRVEAEQLKEELKTAAAELQLIEQRLAQLLVLSQADGVFYLPPSTQQMHERFVKQGQLLAYVLDRHEVLIKAVVSQNDVGLIQASTDNIEVFLASLPGQVFTAYVKRHLPEASRELPSPALGANYGGEIAMDPSGSSERVALDEWFQLDVALNAPPAFVWPGARVWVKFELGSESLLVQTYRRFRQLFMKTLSI